MSFLEYLKNILTGNKKSAKIITKELSKVKGDPTPLAFGLSDNENHRLAGKKIFIELNGKTYEKVTDVDGVCTLNINLNTDLYTALATFKGDDEYNKSTAYTKIRISPVLTASDLTMTQGDGSKFKVKATGKDGDNQPCIVNITVNGKTYGKETVDGVASLNINLGAGTYNVISECIDSKIENIITVKPAPTPTPAPKPVNCNSPYTQTPLLLKQGSGALGQKTSYSCGPHCLMQAFYHLTGVDMSEETIMEWAGTTTAGTGHAGLNTAVAQFNKKYGENIRIEWRNLSDFGNTTSEQLRNIGKLKCEGKFVFFHLLYRNQYGHYETYKANHGIDQRFDIANSLGNRQGNGYYGYIENRSYTTQKNYIKGISQPSVAILSKVR